ncbi:MAG: gliding motility protein RemB, partial [Daejeonella sp.]
MKNGLFIFCFTIILLTSAHAQTLHQILPYSFQFYQKFDRDSYSPNTNTHTSLKPCFLDDSLSGESVRSALSFGIDTTKKNWFIRKIFNEHLIEVNKEDYTFYGDILPDLSVGRDINGHKNTWLNSRGYQFGGTVGSKFSFYTSGYENQGRFPEYYNKYVNAIDVIPGQSYDRSKGDKEMKDWSYVTALLSYTPVKYVNITAGQDKTFIGDGYRSMLLSDYASNYPFVKLTANLGNVQYMSMWASLQDPSAKRFSYDAGYRKKGGVFHYLDWNVNKRLSIGFFDAIIWGEYDDEGNRRGFDWAYANPLIFLRPLEAMSGSPDNAVLGLTGKYELLDKLSLYGQFL